MQVTTSRINVTAYQGGDPPHDVIPRKLNEVWLVSHQPIEMDKPIQWSNHQKETHVYIPVCPYLVMPEPDLAMAYMLQLGMRVSFDLGKLITRLHIVIGSPVHQVEHEGRDMWQVQFGFGILTQ